MAALRISELARRTGFPPATLRYYESVGLLDPQRDPNGYRRYGEVDVERLRFVARAKQLGLHLDEIVELLGLRGDGACPPVRGRLAELVVDKLAEARRSITELGAFEVELARLVDQLTVSSPPAACGDECGCPDHPITLDPAPPPACGLDEDAHAERRAEWRAIVEDATTHESTARGWHLTFPSDPGLAARIAGLAAAERHCCEFLAFTVEVADGYLLLEVRVDAGGETLAAELFAPRTV